MFVFKNNAEKFYSAKVGHKLGLIDELVDGNDMVSSAIKFCHKIADKNVEDRRLSRKQVKDADQVSSYNKTVFVV